jgi:hypothetical protein
MAFRGAVLTGRFVCELAAVAAVAYWGYETAGGLAGIALGAVSAAALMVFWGTFLAPRRRVDLSLPARLVLELGVWLVAAAALWSAGQPALAGLLLVAAVVTGAVNATFRQ